MTLLHTCVLLVIIAALEMRANFQKYFYCMKKFSVLRYYFYLFYESFCFKIFLLSMLTVSLLICVTAFQHVLH